MYFCIMQCSEFCLNEGQHMKIVVVVVVCSGLMSLSTIFQSYHDGVWL